MSFETVVNDYYGLARAMRARAEQLGISRVTLGWIAGTSDGHVNKLLTDPPRRNMGITSLGELLQGLALELVVREDLQQLRKIERRLVRRDARQVRLGVKRRRRSKRNQTSCARELAG